MIEMMPYIWLAIVITMAILEAATAQMISVWFVIGGIAALISSAFTDSPLIQIIVFILVTALSLVLTRPFVKKLLRFKKEDTNAGRYIGRVGVVTEEINNEIGLGQVNVSGSMWTARSSDDNIIPFGCKVYVEEIKGVKLIVHQIK